MFVKEREREREGGKTSGVGKEAQTSGCGVCEKGGRPGVWERERRKGTHTSACEHAAWHITMGDRRQ